MLVAFSGPAAVPDPARVLHDGVAHSWRAPASLDLLVLNLRYELLYYQYGVCAVGGADGCTSFALLPDASANGHLLLGQNWDWIPGVKGAFLHTREADGLETLGFTEAGIVGAKIGLNSAGLGLVINGMMSTVDDWSRAVMPFHVRCYEILRRRTLAEAASVITDTPRSCSANFLIAQTPDHALNIEASPDAVSQIAAKWWSIVSVIRNSIGCRFCLYVQYGCRSGSAPHRNHIPCRT